MAMEGILCHLSVKILLISLFLLILPGAINGVDDEELQDMISALRWRGYNLFSNAILVSDLQEDILSGRSFTFFVPSDSAVFSLDLRSSADHYLQTLRCHIVTSRRLSASILRSVPPSGSFLPTLHPHRSVFLASRAADFATASQILTVDGIDVVNPGIFYSHNIAVHGLGGVLGIRPPAGVLRSSGSLVWPATHADFPAPPDIQYPLPMIPSPSFPMSEPPEMRTLTHIGAPSEILSPYSSMQLEIDATPVLEQARSPVWSAIYTDLTEPPEIQPPLPVISSPSFPISEPPESAIHLAAAPPEPKAVTPACEPPAIVETPVPRSIACSGTLPTAAAPGIPELSISWREMGEGEEGPGHGGMQRGCVHTPDFHVDSRNDFF